MVRSRTNFERLRSNYRTLQCCRRARLTSQGARDCSRRKELQLAFLSALVEFPFIRLQDFIRLFRRFQAYGSDNAKADSRSAGLRLIFTLCGQTGFDQDAQSVVDLRFRFVTIEE